MGNVHQVLTKHQTRWKAEIYMQTSSNPYNSSMEQALSSDLFCREETKDSRSQFTHCSWSHREQGVKPGNEPAWYDSESASKRSCLLFQVGDRSIVILSLIRGSSEFMKFCENIILSDHHKNMVILVSFCKRGTSSSA